MSESPRKRFIQVLSQQDVGVDEKTQIENLMQMDLQQKLQIDKLVDQISFKNLLIFQQQQQLDMLRESLEQKSAAAALTQQQSPQKSSGPFLFGLDDNSKDEIEPLNANDSLEAVQKKLKKSYVRNQQQRYRILDQRDNIKQLTEKIELLNSKIDTLYLDNKKLQKIAYQRTLVSTPAIPPYCTGA